MKNKDLREPIHIIIDGIGGLHCNNNEEALKERIEDLEKFIKRSLNILKGFKKELDNPTSNLSVDLKFSSVLQVIEYDYESVMWRNNK